MTTSIEKILSTGDCKKAKLQLIEGPEKEIPGSYQFQFGDDYEWTLNTAEDPVEAGSADARMGYFVQRMNTYFACCPRYDPREFGLAPILRQCARIFLNHTLHGAWKEAEAARVQAAYARDMAQAARRPLFRRRPDDAQDSAAGAVYGALAGAAFGVSLDGMLRPPNATELAEAKALPGGGPRWLAPGQITADAESLICALRALSGPDYACSSSSSKQQKDKDKELCSFNAAGLRKELEQWAATGPVDGTMDQAAARHRVNPFAMMGLSAPVCLSAWPCRSLVWTAALGLWGRKLPPEQLAQFVVEAAGATNLEDPAPPASACVALAVAYLAENADDPQRHTHAFETARYLADTVFHSESLLTWLETASTATAEGFDKNNLGALAMFGPLGSVFCLAFMQLLLKTPYVQALEEAAALGGAVSTNAAVVGTLLGAYWGAWAVPTAWKDAVLNHTTERVGVDRPDWVHPAQVPALLEKVLAASPTSVAASPLPPGTQTTPY